MSGSEYLQLNKDCIRSLKLHDLQHNCRLAKLKIGGKKDELVTRLIVNEVACQMYQAAQIESLKLLQYLKQRGCKDGGWKTCIQAAENGHLDCLKWAHENGCHWNSYTCIVAAKNGHLECLKYAIENGCDREEVYLFATAYKQQKIMDWLLEHGYTD